MRRSVKIALFILAGLAVFLAVGAFGLRIYLNSPSGRTYASAKLSQAIGAPVQIDDLSVGMGGLTAKFRILEPGTSQAPAQEWFQVEEVEADVTLSDLVLNRAAPTRIHVRGMNIALKLDRQGNLLTHLPAKSPQAGTAAIPAITIENAAVRIEQEGRPAFSLSGVQLQIDPEGTRARLTGSIADPNWGTFTVSGDIATDPLTGEIAVDSNACNVDVEHLRSIPIIPGETWKHLNPRGKSGFHASVSGPLDESMRYEVRLQPDGQADLLLPDLGSGPAATVRTVTGAIVVKTEGIDLQQASGTLAQGTVRVNGEARYEQDPATIVMDVAASGLDVRQVPPEWNLPTSFEGKLRGQADLKILIHEDGSIEPRGGGDAVIDLTGLPPGASGDLTFRLRSNGARYRFEKVAADSPRIEPDKDKQKTSRRLTSRHRRVACAGQPPGAKEPPPKAKEKDDSTTLDAELTLRNIDVAELLKRLKVSIPNSFRGKVDTRLTIAVPLEKAGTFNAYRFSGHIESPRLQVENLFINNASAELAYENGVLSLVSLKGRLPHEDSTDSGTFAGTARAELDPRGELTASLQLTRVPVGQLLRAFVGPEVDVTGAVDATMSFSGPVEELKDPRKWVASADVRSEQMSVFGRSVKDARARLTVDQGVTRLTEARSTFEGLPVSMDASLDLTGPYRFKTNAATSAESIADIRELLAGIPIPLEIEGKFKIQGELTGTISPLSYKAAGSLNATEVVLGSTAGNAISFDWSLDDGAARISKLSASVFRGTITGSADIPLDEGRGGEFQVDFKDLDSALVTKSLEKFPIALTGKVSGGFKGRVPPAKPGDERAVTGDLDLRAESLTVQGLPAERLTGSVRFIDESASYQLEGHTLGGTFDLEGRYPLGQKAPEAKEPSGQFNLRNADLARLSGSLGFPAVKPLSGTLNLNVGFNDDFSGGSGRFSITSISWDRQPLSETLSGNIRLKDQVLSIGDVGGVFAGGQIRAFARFVGRDPGRNFFRISITRAQSERLFAFVPSAKDAVKGLVSITLSGRLGEEYSTGTGRIDINHGTLFGLGMAGLVVPIQWTLSEIGGEVLVRNAYTQSGQGRITGALSYRWGIQDRLEGNIQFQNLLLRSVLGDSGGSLFGSGRITGRLDIGGYRIRSVNDIRGTFRAMLNNTSVRELPILSAASPFLNISGLASPFQAGEVVGRFQNGIFNLERLALSNSSAKLFGSGIILLSSGRLDLDLVALTGNFSVGAQGLGLLAARIPAFGPIPLSLIQDISDFLSNRTIRLSVGGTVKNPVVRVNTSALLADEAVRFLMGRYVLGAAGIESIYAPNRK